MFEANKKHKEICSKGKKGKGKIMELPVNNPKRIYLIGNQG